MGNELDGGWGRVWSEAGAALKLSTALSGFMVMKPAWNSENKTHNF